MNEAVLNPKDINVALLSLNFTPRYPNIPLTENTLSMTYNGVTASFSVDPTDRYEGIVASSGVGNNLVDELNTKWASAFGLAYSPWSFDSDNVRLVFTAEPAKAFQFNSAGSTLQRRLGLANTQLDVA